MAVTRVDGYPQSEGSKVTCVARVSGVNYTAGTPQTIYARDFGMGYITHVSAGVSESNTYFALGKVSGSTGATSAALLWFTSSNGSEATADLSAEYVTVRVEGLEGGV